MMNENDYRDDYRVEYGEEDRDRWQSDRAGKAMLIVLGSLLVVAALAGSAAAPCQQQTSPRPPSQNR